MIKEIKSESYIPKGFKPDPTWPSQDWYPRNGDLVFLKNKPYVVIDDETDMGGNRTIAIVRVNKTRAFVWPWAHLRFVRDVDFHKICLPTPYGLTTAFGARA
jgi:hypothetical protein